MDNIIEIASNVSTPIGVAGLALGLLTLIIKGLIGKLPTVQKAKSYDTIKLILDRFFSLAVIVVVIAFVSHAISDIEPALGRLLDRVMSSTQNDSVVLEAQLRELSSLDQFLGRKNEIELRELFDFPHLEAINIRIVRDRILKLRATGGSAFDIAPYLAEAGEGGMLLDFEIAGAHLAREGGGFEYMPDYHDVAFIVLTGRYFVSMKTLQTFSQSPLLPSHVIADVKRLDDAVAENVNILIRVLNDMLHESEDNYLRSDEQHTRYFSAVHGQYADRFIQLKPKTDEITDAIRKYLRVDASR